MKTGNASFTTFVDKIREVTVKSLPCFRHGTTRLRQFIDVSGRNLYAGVRLPTAKYQQYITRGNRMAQNAPDYWEILVEEHDGAFYARFFVNIAKFRLTEQ